MIGTSTAPFRTMSGRSNRGGRTSARGNGRGRGRGDRAGGRSSSTAPKKQGMCATLGSHVFDHGDRGAADQVKITWEKLTTHVATLYGTDIGTELTTNVKFVIPKPTYPEEEVERHDKAEVMRKDMATLLKSALENEANRIKDRIKANQKAKTDIGSDPYLLAEKTNKIRMLDLEIANDEPIQLKGEAKTKYDSDLKIYKARVQALEKHRVLNNTAHTAVPHYPNNPSVPNFPSTQADPNDVAVDLPPCSKARLTNCSYWPLTALMQQFLLK